MIKKYSKTYHSTNKIKPADVKSSSYIDFSKENKKENLEFEFFEKGYVPIWSEEVFLIKKFKNTGLRTNVIRDLNDEEIFGRFYKQVLKKQIKKS